jgi:hypothetical protein
MAQIVKGFSPLSDLGTQLGQGLSTGLQMLAHNKMQSLARNQTQQGLSALFSPEQSELIASLPQPLQQEFVKQKLKEPSQQAFSQALSALLGGGQPMEPQAESPEHLAQSGVNPLTTPGLNAGQALQLAQLGLKQKGAAEKSKAGAFKETKEERKEINTKARAARQNIHDLERMQDLEKEGKLDTPGYAEFLKRSGFDIPALMNPGSEEFNKIAANFLRDAKTYFGARISNYELEQFLKTIPSLSQSPEGRKRVISNLKYMNRVALEYNNALKDVIKENKGTPPYDLLEKVDDKIDNRLDAIAKKFKKDLAKPVPKGQSSYITALQASLGSLAGAPGRLLGGASSLVGLLG